MKDAKKKVKTKKITVEVNDLVTENNNKVVYKITVLTNENAILEDAEGKEKLMPVKKLKFAEILMVGRRYLLTPYIEEKLCGVVKIKKVEGHRFTYNEHGKDFSNSIYNYVDIIEITAKNLLSGVPFS